MRDILIQITPTLTPRKKITKLVLMSDKNCDKGQTWWFVSLIPAHRRQRQMELCEFQASHGCTVSETLLLKINIKDLRESETA